VAAKERQCLSKRECLKDANRVLHGSSVEVSLTRDQLPSRGYYPSVSHWLIEKWIC